MTADTWRKLRTLPTVGRLAPVYAMLGVLKHVVSLQRLVRWAWTDELTERNPEAERRAIAAVNRLRRWFGKDTDCLQCGLLLYRELSRLGANPLLAVGFRRQHGRIEGHAWVFLDGHVVSHGAGRCDGFETAVYFGQHGMPLAEPLP